MKWFTVILALGIFTLNVKPVIDYFQVDHCVEQKACCSSENGNQAHDGEEKSCNQDICNPFLSCCAPVLMIPQKSHLSFSVFSRDFEPSVFYKSLHALLVECDVWQPPELA